MTTRDEYYTYVAVAPGHDDSGFTPDDPTSWVGFGAVANWTQSGNVFLFEASENAARLQLSVLSSTAFRVRFRPEPNANYSPANDHSLAVVTQSLGKVNATAKQTGRQVTIQTGAMDVVVDLDCFAIAVYRDGQLISTDTEGRGVWFIPGSTVVASFKATPPGELYFGFGEKAGDQLAKNSFSMTFFNYDNFTYAGSDAPSNGFGPVLPYNNQGGPLNPSEPLYNSMPLLVAWNPAPRGNGGGASAPYAYGVFLDNPAQTYFNLGSNDYTSTMTGKYYFGALFGELNYYFMLGETTSDIVRQYTTLTGPAAMPPMYAFGYQQGCYGYYDRDRLMAAAKAYRDAKIPIDGLHIDVDFQDNYRTFTSSNKKFPNVAQMFSELKSQGFKCSTNITALVSANPYDETGSQNAPYSARKSGLALEGGSAFLSNSHANPPPESPSVSDEPFIGNENYGGNYGVNPFSYYAPHFPDGSHATPQDPVTLGSYGYYPDFGREDVQQWWGQQYKYLLDAGLEMIWQDMTCPALSPSVDSPATWKTFPLSLLVTGFGEKVANATVHNGYALNLIKSTFNGLRALDPDKRHFIIARGGYAGVHRYAGIWTGDSASSWDFLRINIPEVLGIGLSGQPISGCDIGGFANGSGCVPYEHGDLANSVVPATLRDGKAVGGNVLGGNVEAELLTRWIQLGAFLPWFRNHYDGYTKAFQEPYAYPDPYKSACRTYIELRYRLIQVFYDAMYRCTQDGTPICRPLFFGFEEDSNLYSGGGQFDRLNDQFLLGDTLLIAPMVQPGSSSGGRRFVYLPGGDGVQWYAYTDEGEPIPEPNDGGQGFTWTVPINLVPIYVRAGAILPMRGLVQWIDPSVSNPITFVIYPGPDSTYALYQDDGISTAAETSGAYRLTRVSHTAIKDGQSIRLQRIQDNYTPPEPAFFISLRGTGAPSKISVSGKTLGNPAASAQALQDSPVNAWYHDTAAGATNVKVFDTSANITVNIV